MKWQEGRAGDNSVQVYLHNQNTAISPHSLCGSLSVNVYLQCASHLMMEEKVQQRMCINFCFCLGKTGAETYEMLQAVLPKSIGDI